MLEFKIPEVGENITSGTITQVYVNVGDTVKKNQDLMEMETDKASLPIPSSVSGTIKEVLVKSGDEVKVGQVVLKIDSAQSTTEAPPKDKPQATTEEETIDNKPLTIDNTSTSNQQPAASNSEENTHVVIIGGGPGGYTAAFMAADLGLQTTLIDLDKNPGGVCLYRGCIPSKALLHAAKVMNEAREASNFGVEFTAPKVDLKKLRTWKESVVERLTGGLGQLSKQRKINYIQGRASFTNSNTISIEKADGKKETLAFDKAILATGSRPIFLPNWPKSDRIIDSTGALEITSIPKKMLVIGGGVIGLELGTVYAGLGTKIDVVEMLPHIIAGADRDIVNVLQKRLKEIFQNIYTETKVTDLKDTGKAIVASFEDKAGKTWTEEYDKILTSIGRKPNSENLGLENTKVVVSDRGFVQANAQQQTDDPSIFAIGDLIGQPMLAHKASHEGIVAAEVIAGHKAAFEPKTIPGVVYTDPEVAWAGLTETEAKEKNIEYAVSKFPWGASGRAISQDRIDGLTKILIDPKTELILGVAIVGPGAGELIAEGVLAIEMGATATDLKMCIHPHPTLSETMMESAEGYFGKATHIYRPKK